MSEIFVCTAMTPATESTPSGIFTNAPAENELGSNVVGLDVYNKDKQNIGTIKDIALDASGLNGYIVGVGGLLGMGDHYVVVRPSAISFNARDNKWHATMIRTLISLGPHQNTNTPANPDQSHQVHAEPRCSGSIQKHGSAESAKRRSIGDIVAKS